MYEEPTMPRWVKNTLLILGLILVVWAVFTLVQQNADAFKDKADVEQTTPLQQKESGKTAAAANIVIGPQNIADMVEMVSPAVVNIEANQVRSGYGSNLFQDPFFDEFFGDNFDNPGDNVETAIGSGFIINKEGYVVTNQHVIDGADEIKVNLVNGDSYTAEVVGQDYEMDLAVLKIAAKTELTPLELGNSEKLRAGEWVIAIGNPYGLDHTVTAGVVSAKGRPMQIENRVYKDLIQTDAAINPGNSGGPLLNTAGQVIGINTAVNAQAQGIGFAISIDTARQILDELISKGKVIRPYIGIYLQPVSQEIADYLKIEKKGIIVAGIEPNSPAEQAGLQRYDVITHIDQQEINNYEQLQEVLKQHKVGDGIGLQVIREGVPMLIPLKLAEKP